MSKLLKLLLGREHVLERSQNLSKEVKGRPVKKHLFWAFRWTLGFNGKDVRNKRDKETPLVVKTAFY